MKITTTQLKQDGDFRSAEAVEILKECDIVISNPPFSLFREYVAQLIQYEKKFLILGNNNAITYKEIFPLFKNNKMWLGVQSNKTMEFRLHESYVKWNRLDVDGNKYGKVPAISWFTNMEHNMRNQPLILYKKYTPEDYPKYDNYNIINLNKVKDIPINYDGVMGVPITFLGKYNPDQFEIVGSRRWSKNDELLPLYRGDKTLHTDNKTLINGKETYDRIFIKKITK